MSHLPKTAGLPGPVRQSFVHSNLPLMQQPEAYIGEADKLVDEHGKVAVGTGENCLAAS